MSRDAGAYSCGRWMNSRAGGQRVFRPSKHNTHRRTASKGD